MSQVNTETPSWSTEDVLDLSGLPLPDGRAIRPGRTKLTDLVHPHDADRLVALIMQASGHRQDTIVRIRRPDLGWTEVSCTFVPMSHLESMSS